MVSTLVSMSPSHFTNPWVTAPSAQITIGITVTFMFQSFFQFKDLCWIEMFEIELFNRLSVCKQMTDV